MDRLNTRKFSKSQFYFFLRGPRIFRRQTAGPEGFDPVTCNANGKHAPVGILLTNIGSPEAATPRSLRPFLAQFLSDRRVINYPRWFWLPILYGIILNTRPRRSARLYENIWTPQGSPLVVAMNSQAARLAGQIARHLSTPFEVVIGMRYGEPSIARGLRQLRDAGAERILVFPLFPQYSASTTATSLDAVFDEIRSWLNLPAIRTIKDYHDHPAYIEALAASIQSFWEQNGKPGRLLFSFHGIPERYAENGDPYREQCEKTARLAAARLGLAPRDWALSFQSRFGPEPWLQPYTDRLLEEWGAAGLQHVQVICPGFSADCLETLDEIGREACHTFQTAGGGEFHYIPALNDRPGHIAAMTQIVQQHLKGWVQPVEIARSKPLPA